MNMKKVLMLFLASLLILPTIAFATSFESGEEVFVTETLNDDAYIAGGLVQLEADVNGDLMIAGGSVTTDAKVSQDLTIAGGEITVRGEVGDDLRIGGGNVLIDSTVKDDVLIGAGNVELGPNSFVGGNLTFGAGNLVLNGIINGHVLGGAGNILINNEIKGDVTLYNVETLQFGPKGKILGSLLYKSAEEAKGLTEEKVLGLIEYEKIKPIVSKEDAKNFIWTMVAGFSIFRLLSALFVGLFFIWIFRFCMLHTVETAHKKSLKSLGIGFLILVLTPIAALLFLISGIGIPISFFLMLSWLLALFVAKLVAMLMIGMKIVKIKEKSGFLRTYGAFALGAFLFIVIGLIPVIGWLFKLLLTLIGLGAIVFYQLELFHLVHKKKLI